MFLQNLKRCFVGVKRLTVGRYKSYFIENVKNSFECNNCRVTKKKIIKRKNLIHTNKMHQKLYTVVSSMPENTENR